KTVLPNEREMAVGAFNFNKTRHRTYIGMKSIFVSMGLSLSTHLAHYPITVTNPLPATFNDRFHRGATPKVRTMVEFLSEALG
ncbi:hypothetical protein, partial [Endozoicomonas sp.]|uniref:hypothetical protein n=1 Tax=Endozoicomonas sp. TaxID=1892382 RepID=UPI003839EFA9